MARGRPANYHLRGLMGTLLRPYLHAADRGLNILAEEDSVSAGPVWREATHEARHLRIRLGDDYLEPLAEVGHMFLATAPPRTHDPRPRANREGKPLQTLRMQLLPLRRH